MNTLLRNELKCFCVISHNLYLKVVKHRVVPNRLGRTEEHISIIYFHKIVFSMLHNGDIHLFNSRVSSVQNIREKTNAPGQLRLQQV